MDGTRSRFASFNTIRSLLTGSRYMTRIGLGPLRLHIFHRGDEGLDCHDHPWDFWTFPLVSYVEEVVRPEVADAARAQEVTIVGRATETRLVRAFRLHRRRAEHTHRVLGAWSGEWHRWGIEAPHCIPHRIQALLPFPGDTPMVAPGKRVVTIVWASPIRREWGFVTLLRGVARWTASRKYLGPES